MGRLGELSELFDGTITPYNFTWYVYAELLPKLTKMREEGQLLHNQTKPYKKMGIEGRYMGETDLQGNACGRG